MRGKACVKGNTCKFLVGTFDRIPFLVLFDAYADVEISSTQASKHPQYKSWGKMPHIRNTTESYLGDRT